MHRLYFSEEKGGRALLANGVFLELLMQRHWAGGGITHSRNRIGLDGGNADLEGSRWGDEECPGTMLVRGSQGLDHTGFWTYGKRLPLFVVHLDLMNKSFWIQSISSSLMRHSQPSWGAALFRKPSVIGIPHCSLLEPGKPVAFHSSADQWKYTLFLLESTSVLLAWNKICCQSPAWKTHTPSLLAFLPFFVPSLLLRKRTLCFYSSKLTFRKKPENLPPYRLLDIGMMWKTSRTINPQLKKSSISREIIQQPL